MNYSNYPVLVLILLSLVIIGCTSLSADPSSINSIDKAFKYKGQIKCYFSDNNGINTTLFVSDNKQRIETSVAGEKIIMLYTKTDFYSWSEKTGKGHKWNIEIIEKFAEEFGTGGKSMGQYTSATDYGKKYDKTNITCLKYDIPANNMVPDPKIKFEDITTKLREVQEKIEEVQQQIDKFSATFLDT